MEKSFSFLFLLVTISCVSCSQVASIYKESPASPPNGLATINSYLSGGDYLTIHKLDGNAVPKSKQYLVNPGLKHLTMSAIYKGLVIEEMQYRVKVEAGKSYTLKPSLSEITERWLPRGSEFKTRSFMPLFLDDQSGKQLYPPLPKTSKNH